MHSAVGHVVRTLPNKMFRRIRGSCLVGLRGVRVVSNGQVVIKERAIPITHGFHRRIFTHVLGGAL